MYKPASPLLGIYPKTKRIFTQKQRRTPMYTAALFTMAKIQKPSKCPQMDAQIKKTYIMEGIPWRSSGQDSVLSGFHCCDLGSIPGQGIKIPQDTLAQPMCIYLYTHIYNRVLFSHKKKIIMPFVATWMDLEGLF